jgi:glycine/D-amino acid oxidase-like deaminating enzyme
MSKAYDVIVVGARCAGSPTAMLLARSGYDVLLVDKATFPSDMMSTHFITAVRRGRPGPPRRGEGSDHRAGHQRRLP